MLRTNLSTRPFYNERAVHLLLGLAAVVVLGFTALNLYEVVDLSRQNTDLSAQISRETSEATRLTREAARIRAGINRSELDVVVAAAREANTIIDQRTFSWTELFNWIEQTLPPEVMVTAVQPAIDQAGTRVGLTVVGRRTADIDEFMEKLEATGAFESVQDRQMEHLDGGLTRVLVEARYVPHLAETEKQEPTAEPNKTANGGAR